MYCVWNRLEFNEISALTKNNFIPICALNRPLRVLHPCYILHWSSIHHFLFIWLKVSRTLIHYLHTNAQVSANGWLPVFLHKQLQHARGRPKWWNCHWFLECNWNSQRLKRVYLTKSSLKNIFYRRYLF